MQSSHFFEYKKQLEQAVFDLDPEPIMAAADILFTAWKNKKSVYIFGNGGSWSTAEHFACDLRKWSRVPGSGGLRAIALTLSPLASAYANDHDYSEIFSRQLNDLLQAKDVAIGISCSGKSPNVVNALQLASRPALLVRRILITGPESVNHVWALTGTDVRINVETPDIRVQEDMHLAVCHILAGEVKERIAQFAKEALIEEEA